MNSRINSVISCFLIGLLPATAALADEFDDAEVERCVTISRIDRTEVLDNRRIIFYMRGKDIYLNQLPRDCGGLGSQKRFSYQSRGSQLCRMDTITVLNSAGPGLMRGATCGLGPFVPITEEDVEAMKNPEAPITEAEDLPSAEPEEVGETG